MAESPRYLVFGGKTGWIGQKVLAMLQAKGITAVAAESRLERIQDVAAEIDAFKPTHVLNCAGLTGRPNVDWCEDHKDEVVRVNVVGTLGLLDACETRGIHITNFATGCVRGGGGGGEGGGVAPVLSALTPLVAPAAPLLAHACLDAATAIASAACCCCCPPASALRRVCRVCAARSHVWCRGAHLLLWTPRWSSPSRRYALLPARCVAAATPPLHPS